MTFKEKILAALKRAAWTALEVIIASIPVGAALEDVSWTHLLSVAVVAAILSLLKSLLVSMPEVALEAQLQSLKDELEYKDRLSGVVEGPSGTCEDGVGEVVAEDVVEASAEGDEDQLSLDDSEG